MVGNMVAGVLGSRSFHPCDLEVKRDLLFKLCSENFWDFQPDLLEHLNSKNVNKTNSWFLLPLFPPCLLLCVCFKFLHISKPNTHSQKTRSPWSLPWFPFRNSPLYYIQTISLAYCFVTALLIFSKFLFKNMFL